MRRQSAFPWATLLALGLLVLCAAAAVDDSVPLPDTMAPLLKSDRAAEGSSDASGQMVDPPVAEPPEETEDFRRVRDALRAMGSAPTCESPFGTRLGAVHGVEAYSNCHDSHISEEDHVYTTMLPGAANAITVAIGMKWQCVEFARRYLLDTYGYIFDDVMGAVDIWRFTSVHKHGEPEARGHLGRYANHDDADRHPAPGSMVIWPIQKDMPFGHVAIVSEVILLTPEEQAAAAKAADPLAADSDSAEFLAASRRKRKPRRVARVRIGDQNYKSAPWPQPAHLRELFLETYDNEYFGLVDPDGYRTLGWMTYESDIKPLDYLLHADAIPGMPKPVVLPENLPQFKPKE